MRLTVAALLLFAHVAAAAPRTIAITAAEAKQHELSHAISIDVSNTGFTPATFPQPDVYLRLSGPPGGPLGIELRDQPRKLLDDSTLQRHVMVNFDVKDVSKVASVKLAGRTWRGVAFIKGESLARSINVYLVDGKGLAIHLVHAAGATQQLASFSVAGVVAMKPFDSVLPTLITD